MCVGIKHCCVLLMPRRRQRKNQGNPSETPTPNKKDINQSETPTSNKKETATLKGVYDLEKQILLKVEEPGQIQQELDVERAKVKELELKINELQKELSTQKSLSNDSWLLEKYQEMEKERNGECFGLSHIVKVLQTLYFEDDDFTDEQIMKLLGIKQLDRKKLQEEYEEEVKAKYKDATITDRIWGNAHRSDITLGKIWWLDNGYKFIPDRERRHNIENILRAQGKEKSEAQVEGLQAINAMIASRIRAL